MKILITSFLLMTLLSCSSETSNIDSKVEGAEAEIQEGYDATLADQLGADEYGMSTYVIAFLKSGPNRDQDSTTAAELQKAHLQNIRILAEEGKLALAGPFLDDGDIRGIYIFNVTTIEEARQLTESDPAIQEGRLVMELHPWYGSAAIKQINDLHQKVAKKQP